MRTYELATQVPNKVMDINTSRYWTICIIANPLDKNFNLTKGYRDKQSILARNFFEEEFPQLKSQTSLSKGENQYVQVSLWNTFHNQTLDAEQRAKAGICLRCFVSHAIVQGCKILAKRAFDFNKIPFETSFENFLAYVLNDDGNTFVVVDSDGKTQLIVKDSGEIQPIPKAGKFVSVEVLSSYNPHLSNSKSSESLDNWCIRRIKQNKDLQTLLLEYGVWVPSDWSLLCREVPQKLYENNYLKDCDCHLIKVFHKVYRRDRRESCQRGRCSKPTNDQLEEMLLLLKSKDVILSSASELIQKFQEIAEILRQDNHSSKIGKPQADSLDVSNSSEDNNDSLSKLNQLGTENNNCEDMEENELRELLNQLPPFAVYRAISLRIPQRVEILATKKASSTYAEKFVDGLRLYYHEINPLSLKQIAEKWDINWAKARRIFQLNELIDSVQSTSEEIFISKIQEEASQFFASKVSSNPDKLKEIAEEIRSFLDKIVFQPARAELIAPRSPYKNSLFARILRKYMNN
ncbi:MAG: hypothetical protein WBA07_33890 [Rivularia sp. (in: cyanobacteria)]